ncbi:MAG: hypothetical protein AVDCRST_MAG73-1899 [uncultured Thermomicrobiales bacterium]|uniref:FAD-binding domain-containing protein n=1 Tax=uncultured Thermomicrobiales bacterium TaxID=1645740 RepID=A0A6J4U517_9BACT|nr:MAG: hypothetical protein AVDCRST_MAG73-1899 [uncultured Thermomicrobiales bacterium]
MAEERVDAVVVGAGPAGSAAAIAMARAGRRVVLLDRATFPRDKPCGDLIGARAMAWARRLGIAEEALAPYPRLAGALVTAERGVLDLAPGGPVGRILLRNSDARVIPRLVFDAALVAAAGRAGAELRRGTVREVAAWQSEGNAGEGGRVVRGTGPDGAFAVQAPAVVLAGGYGSRVIAPEMTEPLARRVVTRESQPGIATRGYFRGVAAPPDRIVFCLNDWVLPGYGWVFPLPGGGANVGVGTLAGPNETGSGREPLRYLYHRFTTDPASPAAAWLAAATPDGAARTWALDLGPRHRRLVADGLLVAGEAAALVGPLTGAGIAFGLESGWTAGETLVRALAVRDVSARNLAPYGRAIRRRFSPWLRAEGAAQRFLTDPGRLNGLLNALGPLPATRVLGARLLLHLG